MARLVLKRLLFFIPTLLVVSFGIFMLLELSPGDPAREIAGQDATPEVIASIREGLRLDEPLTTRYFSWLGDAAHGDLGRSFVGRQPVMEQVLRALPPTLSMVGLAMVFAVGGALVLGVTPELVPRSRWVGRLTNGITSVMLAVPNFLWALLLVAALAVDRRLLPAVGYVPFAESPWEWFKHLVIPAIALASGTAAELARQLRASLRGVLASDYVIAARARGFTTRRIVLKHGLKNAAIPVVTILGVRLGQIIGTTAVVEQIFIINGVGRLTVTAVLQRDMPIILGVVTITIAIVLVVNLIVDSVYGYFNPRLRTA